MKSAGAVYVPNLDVGFDSPGLPNKLNYKTQRSNMPRVIVNHSGSCEDYIYKAGEVVSLPKEIIEAIGEDSIKYVGKKVKDAEDANVDAAPQDAAVKSAEVVQKG